MTIEEGAASAPHEEGAAFAPHPDFKELHCDTPGTSSCRVHFIEKIKDKTDDKYGWGYCIVVETKGVTPIVTDIHYADPVDGCPEVPPPQAIDIPKLNNSYWKARSQLIRLGYRPIKASDEPWKVCAKTMESEGEEECPSDTTLPEVEDCSGAGLGFCSMFWLAPDGRVLEIQTAGEPQPGSMYYKNWAKPKDLTDLPPNWRRDAELGK